MTTENVVEVVLHQLLEFDADTRARVIYQALDADQVPRDEGPCPFCVEMNRKIGNALREPDPHYTNCPMATNLTLRALLRLRESALQAEVHARSEAQMELANLKARQAYPKTDRLARFASELNEFVFKCYAGGGFNDRVAADKRTARALETEYECGAASAERVAELENLIAAWRVELVSRHALLQIIMRIRERTAAQIVDDLCAAIRMALHTELAPPERAKLRDLKPCPACGGQGEHRPERMNPPLPICPLDRGSHTEPAPPETREFCTRCGKELVLEHGVFACKPCERWWSPAFPPSKLPRHVAAADRRRPHLIDGEFQSDKYPTTPRGKVPLSCKDPTAQDLLWEYAQRRRRVDAEFSDDLEQALVNAGYEPPVAHPIDQYRAGRVMFRLLPGLDDDDRSWHEMDEYKRRELNLAALEFGRRLRRFEGT